MPNIVGRKNFFTETVNFLYGIDGDYCGYFVGVYKAKYFCDGGESTRFNPGIFTKKIDIYYGRIQINFQWANSLASFSGCSAMSVMKCDTAMERTANP